MQKIAFLGLGIMGRAMCARLLEAGHEVTVWNRTAERCVPAVDRGAKQAATPGEAAACADLVLVMVSDPAAARAVYFGTGGAWEAMGEGSSYIDFSTVDPETAGIDTAAMRKQFMHHRHGSRGRQFPVRPETAG